MTASLLFLAQAEGGWFANLVRILSSSTSPTLYLTVTFIVFFLLVVAIFAWAAFFRKPGHPRHHHHSRRHRRHRYSSLPQTPVPDAAGQNATAQVVPYMRRRRRRRHDDAPRNPTLAETGGLPPLRSDDSGPPVPPV
jgi:hypothetical protein